MRLISFLLLFVLVEYYEVRASPLTALRELELTGQRVQQLRQNTLRCLPMIKQPVDETQDKILRVTDLSSYMTNIRSRLASLVKSLPELKVVSSAAPFYVNGVLDEVLRLKKPVDQVEPLLKQIKDHVTSWPGIFRQSLARTISLPGQLAQIQAQIDQLNKKIPVNQNTAKCLAALPVSNTKVKLRKALEDKANELKGILEAQGVDVKNTYNACNGLRGFLFQFKTIYESPGVGDINSKIFATSRAVTTLAQQVEGIKKKLSAEFVCEAELGSAVGKRDQAALPWEVERYELERRRRSNRCAYINHLLTGAVSISPAMRNLAERKANSIISQLRSNLPGLPELNSYLRLQPLLAFNSPVQGLLIKDLPLRFRYTSDTFNKAAGLNA